MQTQSMEVACMHALWESTCSWLSPNVVKQSQKIQCTEKGARSLEKLYGLYPDYNCFTRHSGPTLPMGQGNYLIRFLRHALNQKASPLVALQKISFLISILTSVTRNPVFENWLKCNRNRLHWLEQLTASFKQVSTNTGPRSAARYGNQFSLQWY